MQFGRFYSLNQSIVAWFAHLHQVGSQPTFPNLGKICCGNKVNVKPYAHPQPEKMLIQLIHEGNRHEMQSKHSGTVCTLASGRISANTHKSGELSVVVTVSEKALKPLIYVCHGHGMQLERFYRLNLSKVARYANLHQVGFQPTLTNLGTQLW